MMPTTLAILAGGEGRRMGAPKAELRVAGIPILEYLLDRWRWPGPTLLVTAPGRQRPPGAQRFLREATDPVAGEGPLRGVLTALEASETALVVVTTCDMPLLESRQLEWMAEELEGRGDASIVMLERSGEVEPFPCAIRQAALSRLRDHFQRGERSVRSLATQQGASIVAPPRDWPASSWTNLNTPADLAAFLRSASVVPPR